jgi:outer membrane protein assembly factor BamB
VRRQTIFLALCLLATGCSKGASSGPQHEAEQLVGAAFARPPELVSLDRDAFVAKYVQDNRDSPARAAAMELAGLSKVATKVQADHCPITAFYSPTDNKVYERAGGRSEPVMTKAYWEAEAQSQRVQAFVFALLAERHPHLRLAAGGDEETASRLEASLDAKAAELVIQRRIDAVMADVRSIRDMADADDRKAAQWFAVVRGVSGSGTSLRSTILLNMFREYGGGQPKEVCATLPVMRMMARGALFGLMAGESAVDFIANPPLSDAGAPKRVFWVEPAGILPGWTCLGQGALTPYIGYVTFEKAGRKAVLLCSGPMFLSLQMFSAVQPRPAGGVYGRFVVFAFGLEQDEAAAAIGNALKRVVLTSVARISDVEALRSFSLPDAAADETALRSPGRDLAELLPAACRRHPDKMAAWIAALLPAWLDAVGDEKLFERELSIWFLGLTPTATSPEAWESFVSALAAQITLSAPQKLAERSIPCQIYLKTARGKLRDHAVAVSWSALPDFDGIARHFVPELRDRPPSDTAHLQVLRARVRAAAVAKWYAWCRDELLRHIAGVGTPDQARALATKYRDATTDAGARQAMEQVITEATGAFGSELWRFEDREFSHSTVLAVGTTLFAARRGSLLAIDLRNGAVRWRMSLPGTDPALHDAGGSIVVAHCGDELIALRADGQKAWQTPLRSEHAAVAIGPSCVVHGSKPVVAVSPTTGKQLWSYVQDAYALHSDTDAVLVAKGGDVVCLDARTGKLRWSTPITDTPRRVVRDGGALFIIGDRALWMLDASTGKTVWQSEPGVRLAVSRQHVAVIGHTDSFAILDRNTGGQLWRSQHEFLDLNDQSCLWQGGIETICSEAGSGRERWRARGASSTAGRAFHFGSTVVVPGRQTVGLDAATGVVRWRFDGGVIGDEGACATEDSVVVFNTLRLAVIAVRAVKR